MAVIRDGADGSDGVLGLNLDSAGAAAVLTSFLIDQPVCTAIQRLIARGADTIVR